MRHVLRSEWIKLVTTRTTWALVLCGIGLELLVVGLTAAFVDIDPFDTSNLITAVTAPAIAAGLMLGVVGALVITSEHAHGTIRPTFAATPRRERVFFAKFVVITVAVLGGGAVVIGGALALGWGILVARGAEVTLDDGSGSVGALVGAVLLMTILAWLGYGFGLLTRSSPLAIVLLILWPLLIENLLAGVLFVAGLDGAVRWLPYNAGFVLALVEIPEDSLGRWIGGSYFAAVTLALVAVGVVANRHRDA